MAHKIARLFIRVDLDTSELTTAVSARYRVEDDGAPGTLVDWNKDVPLAADAVSAAEVAAIVAACRTDAGI